MVFLWLVGEEALLDEEVAPEAEAWGEKAGAANDRLAAQRMPIVRPASATARVANFLKSTFPSEERSTPLTASRALALARRRFRTRIQC